MTTRTDEAAKTAGRRVDSDAAALRSARIALFREARRARDEALDAILASAGSLTEDNVRDVEDAVMEGELAIAREFCHDLAALAPFPDPSPEFVHQTGATCMSTSVGNALIRFGEPFFEARSVDTLHRFTDHVVSHTSGFNKPHEYRSVDDMHKYFKRGDAAQLRVRGRRLSRRYRCELTDCLIEVVAALHSGEGACVVQQHAHARLAYAITIDGPDIFVRQRDPFTRHGDDRHSLIELGEWRRGYLWSPLKKLPTTLGHGFDSLSPVEALGHLARYEAMDNLGIECISALILKLGRADDAGL